MSGWRRTVPAVLLFLIVSMPVVYYQAGNLVYTQAAASNLECCLLYTSDAADD